MVIAPIPFIDWKPIFRKRAKAAREKAARMQPNAAQFAASHFLSTFEFPKETKIALYHPKGDELDTWPLAEKLMQAGHPVLLPMVTDKKSPLTFRLFEIERPLIEGPYGIMQPDEEAAIAEPDVIIVPLLGFRPDGARLGYGGGYYDRTLSELRARQEVIAIGYGYAAQKMDRFPVDDHDQFLDGFVSEQGAEKVTRRR